MGKVLESVRRSVDRGDLIACVTPARHVLTCGVSNWGGWALAAACASLCSSAAVRSRVLGTVAEEEALTSVLAAAGARCVLRALLVASWVAQRRVVLRV
jgi:hypothetical protein